MEDIIGKAEEILKYSKNKVDHCIINILDLNQKKVEISNNEVKNSEETTDCSVIIKVFVNKKKGLIKSNILNKELLLKAINNAKNSEKEEYFYGIPEYQKFERLDLFDKKTFNLTWNDLIDKSNEMINVVNKDNVNLCEGSVSKTTQNRVFMNSNGSVLNEKETMMAVDLSGIGKNKSKVSTFSDSEISHSIIDVKKISENVHTKCIDFLKPQKLIKAPTIVVLQPEPFIELLDYGFLDNLNGKNIEKKRSMFCESMDKRILSETLTITDSGKIPNGINSSGCDFEGTKTKETSLIQEGVIKNAIFDFNTAKHVKKDSTGNATSTGIDFSNLIIDNKIKNDVDEYILIENIIGAHTSNPITTDFSVNVNNGYLVKNNEKFALENFMISGKVLDILKNILVFGKEVTNKNGYYTSYIGTNSIKITK